MKIKLLISIFALISIHSIGQIEYAYYPSYNTIIKRFFNKYSITDSTDGSEIYFEKRPTGWYVSVKKYSLGTIKSELFWDSKTGKYNKTNFNKSKSRLEYKENLTKFQNNWAKIYYNICPYYGYVGWDWDVIEKLKDKTNLPDSTLYALGRAYSYYANSLLNDNRGYIDKEKQFLLPSGLNSMTSNQLDEYRYYRHLAIEKFSELANINPNYETIVGAIGLKASNEYLTSFLDMRMYQNEDEALHEIKEGLYSDYTILAAKNLLNSCDTNAILFTVGDNEIYPLLYIQSILKYRADVLVINFNLLQFDRYINCLRKENIGASGIELYLKAEDIIDNLREVVTIDTSFQAPIELSEVFNYVKDEKYFKYHGESKYHSIPSNKFELHQGENKIELSTNSTYILRNQLILLDILASNNSRRPIYFRSQFSDFGINNYLKLDGLAYKLNSFINKPENNNINTSSTFHKLMTDFNWSKLNEAKLQEKLFSFYYRYCFSILSDALLDENKIDSAKCIINKYFEIFPNETLKFDDSTLPFIKNLYKIHEYERANIVSKQLIYNIKNNINSSNEMIYYANDTDYKETLKELRLLAEKYEQKEIVSIIKKTKL
ncbi:MAG: hypothetical protein WCK02_09120 [Bacteroidota bacterium]